MIRSFLVLIVSLLAMPHFLCAKPSTTDWNVAVIDEILASVQPGQQTVRLDDMEILVTNLRSWRNQQAGEPVASAAFEGNVPTWPNGNVYYSFSNNVSAAKQKVFLDGAQNGRCLLTCTSSRERRRLTMSSFMKIQLSTEGFPMWE